MIIIVDVVDVIVVSSSSLSVNVHEVVDNSILVIALNCNDDELIVKSSEIILKTRKKE